MELFALKQIVSFQQWLADVPSTCLVSQATLLS